MKINWILFLSFLSLLLLVGGLFVALNYNEKEYREANEQFCEENGYFFYNLGGLFCAKSDENVLVKREFIYYEGERYFIE